MLLIVSQFMDIEALRKRSKMDLAIIGKMKILKNKRSKNKKLNKSFYARGTPLARRKK